MSQIETKIKKNGLKVALKIFMLTRPAQWLIKAILRRGHVYNIEFGFKQNSVASSIFKPTNDPVLFEYKAQ